MANFAVRLKDLLKIGSEALITTAQTLSGAVNELKRRLVDVSQLAEFGSEYATLMEPRQSELGYNLIPLVPGWQGGYDVQGTLETKIEVHADGVVSPNTMRRAGIFVPLHPGDIFLRQGAYTLQIRTDDAYSLQFQVRTISGTILGSVTAPSLGSYTTLALHLNDAETVQVGLITKVASFAHQPEYEVFLCESRYINRLDSVIPTPLNVQLAGQARVSSELMLAAGSVFPNEDVTQDGIAFGGFLPSLNVTGITLSQKLALIKLPRGYVAGCTLRNSVPEIQGGITITSAGGTLVTTEPTADNVVVLDDCMLLCYEGSGTVLPVPGTISAVVH